MSKEARAALRSDIEADLEELEGKRLDLEHAITVTQNATDAIMRAVLELESAEAELNRDLTYLQETCPCGGTKNFED